MTNTNYTMAFAVSTPTSLLHSSSSSHHGNKSSLSNSTASVTNKNPIFNHARYMHQLGFAPFTQWSGLKQMSISISKYSLKMGKRGKKCKGKKVFASLFGVGAPEALVIGVVALLVFGPKGLAEVARNFGKTLRSFQPTIRELQQVSREFKSTLEREIGLDEINNPVPKNFMSRNPMPTAPVDIPEDLDANKSSEDDGSPSSSGAYTADEYLKVTEDQLRVAFARMEKEQQAEKDNARDQFQSQILSQDALQEEEAASVEPPDDSKPETII